MAGLQLFANVALSLFLFVVGLELDMAGAWERTEANSGSLGSLCWGTPASLAASALRPSRSHWPPVA
jgi:Kef-type K+ transport system membrane component KefB